MNKSTKKPGYQKVHNRYLLVAYFFAIIIGYSSVIAK